MMSLTDVETYTADPIAMDMQSQANNKPTISVMVVEDQQAIAELLIEVLIDAGFEASCAPSALAAAAFARETAPDVILLDVMMPDRNGWDVLEELRSDERTRDIPVVITSAVYDRPGLHALPVGGPIRFAAKPFDIADLVDTVSDLTS
jgi:CheY-like chemotaxis protein